jgi:hypothetical protein
MRELLKRRLELFVKMRWLKTINKETDKYKKLTEKSNRQLYVVNALLKRYYEIYGEDLRKAKGGAE